MTYRSSTSQRDDKLKDAGVFNAANKAWLGMAMPTCAMCPCETARRGVFV